MGNPRPRYKRKNTSPPARAPQIPERQRLVTIQFNIPGYNPTAGILHVPLDGGPVELRQIMAEAHDLLAEMFMGLQKNGN